MDASRWSKVQALYLEVRGLPAEARAESLDQLCGGDAALRAEVEAELRGDSETRAATDAGTSTDPGGPEGSQMPTGTRLGAWQIVRLVGRGGMGEVYEAQRADGTFELRAAVKLLKRGLDTDAVVARFNRERRILAQLDHPNIAHVLDAGVAPDGRPFLVMEYVDGRAITDYARRRDLATSELLQLMTTVCEAVQAAHAKKIVHRDLKPSNVLVTPEGQVKLLDFGIAKALAEEDDSEATRLGSSMAMTPAYAAPEQVLGLPATPASDVYALGCILYQLLVERLPHARGGRTAAEIAREADKETIERPSTVLRKDRGRMTESLRLLRLRAASSDLDLIVLKALHAESQRRYAVARELSEDLQRLLDNRPVLARPDTTAYRTGRFIRRNRVAVAAAAAVVVALALGLTAALWQAQRATREAGRAQQEARRATATKDFLLDVFKASDPRIAQDKPRGQITAKELLDVSADKIESRFSGDPDTQIELLGVAAGIYRELNETDRHARLYQRQVELAKARWGEASPVVIEAMLGEVDMAVSQGDVAGAASILDRADPLIRRAGLDDTATRAQWWSLKSQVLVATPATVEEARHAGENAERLFQRHAPNDPRFAVALELLSGVRYYQGDDEAAVSYAQRGLAIAQRQRTPDTGLLATFGSDLALFYWADGNYDRADFQFTQVEDLLRRSYGESSPRYSPLAAQHAWMLHEYGRRERALSMFKTLLATISSRPDDENSVYALELYAACLNQEGRWKDAAVPLEAALARWQTTANQPFDVERTSGELADTYEASGRLEQAQRLLQGALDIALRVQAPDGWKPLFDRERLGRLLLKRGDAGSAQAQFQDVLAQAHGRSIAPVALTWGDVAHLNLGKGDKAGALEASRKAVEMFERVEGKRDVRWGPRLWLIHSEALLRNGDSKGALEWAQKALEASRRYDDPSAQSIKDAQVAVDAASIAAKQKKPGSESPMTGTSSMS